jgi:histidyl-tRNA synthetase
VRGLDYYTRTVFEFTSDALGAQSGVGGGGRYDGLIEQLGGKPTPGMGWAAGIERILLAAGDGRTFVPAVDLFVAFDGPTAREQAFSVSLGARRAGMTAQMELAGRSLKGQRKQADRVGARWLAVVTADGATLRDMQTGEEVDVPAEGIVARALREGGRG